MMIKPVLHIYEAVRDDIADLVTRRPLPSAGLAYLDPFLFLNHHGPQTYGPHNAGLPFGPHPHRGFETVTFILDGSLAHLDSGGHESVIEAGGVQWMTAGRGLVHAEISPASFRREGGSLEILQLWVNLPARLKMCEPRYIGLQAADIPVAAWEGASARIISGRWRGVRGPIDSLTDVFMSVVTLRKGARLDMDGLSGRTVFLYVTRGEAQVQGVPARSFQLVELDPAGDDLAIVASSDAVLLLGHAQPLGEPVASHGPFVMNTYDEIRAAIDDYRAGMFGALSI